MIGKYTQFKILKYMCCLAVIYLCTDVNAGDVSDGIKKTKGSNQFSLKRSVISSGGQIVGDSYRIRSAIGQVLTTKSTSTTYQITAGFYQQNRDLIFFNEFESNP